MIRLQVNVSRFRARLRSYQPADTVASMGGIDTEVPTLERLQTAAQLGTRTRSIAAIAAWVVFAVTFLIRAISIMKVDGSALLASVPDDTYYYLEIARHVARGEGFTFDGIHQTDGFHIAWQLLLVPVAAIVPGDVALLRAALVLGLVLMLIASLLIVRLVARIVGVPLAAIAATVVLHGNVVSGQWLNGMEGPVVVLALAFLATAFLAFASQPTRIRGAVTGLACAG